MGYYPTLVIFMKVLAIGDLHRKHKYLNSLLEFSKNYDKVVFVGDYADDFLYSFEDTLKIWELLKSLDPDKYIVLLGNHDAAYAYSEEFYSRYRTLAIQSGWDSSTYFSLKNKPEIKEWLRKLPIVQEIDGVTYSHGGITPYWEESPEKDFIENYWNDSSPLWARPFEFSHKEIPQVFGHTPITTCTNFQKDGNCWGIDTFSTYSDGIPIGDRSILEILDGKTFNKIEEKSWFSQRKL